MLATVKQVLRYISHFDLISTPHDKHSGSLEILLCMIEIVFQAWRLLDFVGYHRTRSV